ncbi:MAG: GlsB/YeaQ/YmgE family stress response membrane protein [Actinobacteria bacterium]|nr:GlsB/YeaQ/YmgE family stress response membrane protein [Actinomycetota bacterium]
MLGAILGIVVSGLIVGALARFAVPGPDPLPIWKTIALGVLGSIVGGLLAALLGFVDNDDLVDPGEAVASFLFSLGGAIVLLVAYRRLAQGRGITGPDARKPPV